jgi:hypothetical protein
MVVGGVLGLELGHRGPTGGEEMALKSRGFVVTQRIPLCRTVTRSLVIQFEDTPHGLERIASVTKS